MPWYIAPDRSMKINHVLLNTKLSLFLLFSLSLIDMSALPQINPFPPDVYICYRIVKILISKNGIVEKICYERRAYESVDDNTPS